MRRPLIAGNWKMHFTVPEGLEYALRLRHDLERHAAHVDLVILPPAVMLWEIANALRGCAIEVGAQNAGWEDQGPFTGEISPKMLAGWCHYLLIGHSERRQLFNETDEELNRKLHAGLRHRLKVILAVGETLEEYEAGRTAEVITRQLNAALYGVELRQATQLSLAYEPVWAIGTGKAATPEYANETMGLIRRLLASPAGAPVGLPTGQPGNSEVGHLTIGAGRIVYQALTRINLAIRDGSFKRNPVLLQAMTDVRDRGTLHLLGLVSPGGVHSSTTHLTALVEMAQQLGVPRTYIHAFTDG